MEQYAQNPGKFALVGSRYAQYSIGPQSGRQEPIGPMLRVIGKSRTSHSSRTCRMGEQLQVPGHHRGSSLPVLPASLRTDLSLPRDLSSPARHMSKHGPSNDPPPCVHAPDSESSPTTFNPHSSGNSMSIVGSDLDRPRPSRCRRPPLVRTTTRSQTT